MNPKSSATIAKMKALRQAKELGCSGAHQTEDGIWRPCASADELVKFGKINEPGDDSKIRGRSSRGVNKIRRQWETPKRREYVAVDTISNADLANNIAFKSGWYAPNDNDVDVFTDISSAQKRSRQLGCIGVSRRVSKTGKTVWMPCTNMTDYSRVAGTTDLGRRHLREQAKRTILEIVEQSQKPLRNRKKSLFSETSTDSNIIAVKALGPKVGKIRRPSGPSAVDISGTIDADMDGIVFEGTPKARPIIPRVNVPDIPDLDNMPQQVVPDVLSPQEVQKNEKKIRRNERVARLVAKIRTSRLNRLTPTNDMYSNSNISKMINDSFPSTEAELMESLKSNPYSRKNWEKTYASIVKAKPDWEETAKIKNLLLGMAGESGDNSGLQKLVRIHGLPTIVATKTQPRHSLFQRKFWEYTTGAYHSDGYIAFNAEAFGQKGASWWMGSDSMSDVEMKHDLRHELAHAFQFMAIAQNQKAKDYFADSFINDFLTILEEPENTSNRRRRKLSMDLSWGSPEEIIDAQKISDYATTARIEYFAESLATALSGDRKEMSKISGQTISHMAKSLGLSIPEMLDIIGRNNEGDFNNIDIPSRSRSQRINKIDKPLVEFANNNPQLLDEIPMRIRKNMSPDTIKAGRESRIDGRRAYSVERTANGTVVGSGGMAVTRKIIGNVGDDFTNKPDKKLYMVAGTSGSGKSTLMERGLIPDLPTEKMAAYLDIDRFKQGLSGYNNGEGAVRVHPAARIALQKTIDASAVKGIDVVLQGYGNDSAQLRRAKSMGYQTVGHFVHTPKSVASKRVEDREKLGGPQIGSELSQILSDELPSVVSQQIRRGLYDEFYLWDNKKSYDALDPNDSLIEPKLIAYRKNDGSYSIENEFLFNKFFGDDSKNIKQYWEMNNDSNDIEEVSGPKVNSYSENKGQRNYKKFTGFTSLGAIKDDDVKDSDISNYIFDNQIFSDEINMTSKNATHASFSFAKMKKSKFNASKLFGAKFNNADLRDADFNSLNDKQITDLRYVDFSNAILTNANMRGAYLQGAHFTHADLRNVDFRSANLLNSNLDGANLSGANLSNAKVLKSQLTNSRWNGSTIFPDGFVPPEMTTLRLDEPSPRRLPGIFDIGPDDAKELRPYVKSGFVGMDGADNSNIFIPGRDLSYATIMSSNFDNSNLDGSNLFESDIIESSMSNALLSNMDMRGSRIDNVDFSYSKMNGSNMDGATISSNTKFNGAKLRNSRLTNIIFENESDFTGADLRNANLANTDLSSAITDEMTNLDGALFSSSKHYPKIYKGEPTVLIPFADSPISYNSDILDTNSPIFQGLDSAKLLEFAEKNLYNKNQKSTYRGLSIDDWMQHLDSVDSHIIDNNDAIAHLANRNDAVSKDVESLKNFRLPDGSSIDVVAYTIHNSPNKFIADVNERREKNPDAFRNPNPELLWERAMSVREQEKGLLQQNEELQERKKELNRLLNLSKTIDALYVNSVYNENDKPIEEPSANLIQLDVAMQDIETLTNFSPRAARKIHRAVNKLVDNEFVVGSRSKRDTKKDYGPKKTSKEKLDDIYKAMTDALIASLEDAKDGKWERPWKLSGLPRNALTGKPYAGRNNLILAMVQNDKGYEMPVWLTFKQAQALGGTVRAGEKGTQGVYWARRESTRTGPDGSEDKSSFLIANFFHVFNIAQTDGIDPERFKQEELSPEQRMETLDKIVAELAPSLRDAIGSATDYDSTRAYYSPVADLINMPPFGSFNDPLSYYQTLMHELVHWTGHPSRLDRQNMNGHGTPEYAYEELVAEIGSVFLMAILGMEAEPQEHHSVYIAGWLKKLKDDPGMVQKASAEAQKAVNLLLSKSPSLQAEYDRGFPDIDETIDAGEKIIDDSLQVVEDVVDSATSVGDSSKSKRLPSPGTASMDVISLIINSERRSFEQPIFGMPIVEQSENHPHVPVVRFPRIPILDESTGLSSDDFSLIDSVEYLTKEQKDVLREFGEQQRVLRSKLINGWAVSPSSDRPGGRPALKLQDALEYRNADGDILFTSKKVSLPSKNKFNNNTNQYIFVHGVYESFWENDDLSQAIFRLDGELSKFDISNITIDDLFDFPDTENGQWIREQLNKVIEYRKNSEKLLEQASDGFKTLAERAKNITSSIEKIDTSSLWSDDLDSMLQHSNDRVMAIKSGQMTPAVLEQLGGFEHEFGHIALGLGFDRHGDFASQYAAYLMHDKRPHIGIVVNAINSGQSINFARTSDGSRDDRFLIPLWADVPESMWGWPESSSSRSTRGSRGAPSFSGALKDEKDIVDTDVAPLTKDGYLSIPDVVEVGNKAQLPDGTTMILDSPGQSNSFVAQGGSLSQVPDIHLAAAIRLNVGTDVPDGKRFEMLGNGGGIHGMLRLRDTATGGMIGWKYDTGILGYGELIEDGPRNEVISEIVAEIFGFPAMPMRMVRHKESTKEGPSFSLLTNLAHNVYMGNIAIGGRSDVPQTLPIEQCIRMLLLDSVIQNGDRGPGNYLIAIDADGNASLIPIDHSMSIGAIPYNGSGLDFIRQPIRYTSDSEGKLRPLNSGFLAIDNEDKYSEFIKVIEQIQNDVRSQNIDDAKERMRKIDELLISGDTSKSLEQSTYSNARPGKQTTFRDKIDETLNGALDRLDIFISTDAREIAERILPKELVAHNAAINKALSLGRMLTQDELRQLAEQYGTNQHFLALAVGAYLQEKGLLNEEDMAALVGKSWYPMNNTFNSLYERTFYLYFTDMNAFEIFMTRGEQT